MLEGRSFRAFWVSVKDTLKWVTQRTFVIKPCFAGIQNYASKYQDIYAFQRLHLPIY